jgi:hypothetical protein
MTKPERLSVIICGLLVIGSISIARGQSATEDVNRIYAAKFRAIIMEPVETFEKQKDCRTGVPYLRVAINLADSAQSPNFDLSVLQSIAATKLDIADRALRKGCTPFAEEVYRDVIKEYVGSGFAAHRQRAEIGLQDIRSRSTKKTQKKDGETNQY